MNKRLSNLKIRYYDVYIQLSGWRWRHTTINVDLECKVKWMQNDVCLACTLFTNRMSSTWDRVVGVMCIAMGINMWATQQKHEQLKHMPTTDDEIECVALSNRAQLSLINGSFLAWRKINMIFLVVLCRALRLLLLSLHIKDILFSIEKKTRKIRFYSSVQQCVCLSLSHIRISFFLRKSASMKLCYE